MLENKYLSESENGIDKLEIYKPKNKNNNKTRTIAVKVIFFGRKMFAAKYTSKLFELVCYLKCFFVLE